MSYQVTERQRNIKCILLRERSLSAKATYCMIPTVVHSKQGQTMETVKRSVVARDLRSGRDELSTPSSASVPFSVLSVTCSQLWSEHGKFQKQ